MSASPLAASRGRHVRRRRQRPVALVVAALLVAGCGARFPQTTGGTGVSADGSGVAVDGSGGAVDPVTGATDPSGATVAGGSAAGAVSGGTAGATGGGAKAPGGGAATGGGAAGPGGTAATVASADIGSTQGVSAKEIKIAVLIPITGAAPVPTSIQESINVAFEYINRIGGVNGRMLKADIKDTTSTLTGAKSAAQKAIEVDKDFMLVILDRIDIQEGVAAYLQTKSFPNIQIQMTPNPPASQDWAFGLTIDQAKQGKLIADYLVKVLGLKKVGIVTETQPQLDPGRKMFTDQIKALGAQVVFDDRIDGQGNDFSSSVLNAKNSGAESLWMYVAPVPAIKYANQANAIGYQPAYMADAISWQFNTTLQSGGSPAMAKAHAFSEWPTLDDPRMATYKKAYADHNAANGSSTKADDLGIPAFGFIQIVAAALKATGPNLGQLAFKRTMTNFSYQPPDGSWAPVSWKQGVRVGTDKVTVYKVGTIDGQPAWQLERDYTNAF